MVKSLHVNTHKRRRRRFLCSKNASSMQGGAFKYKGKKTLEYDFTTMVKSCICWRPTHVSRLQEVGPTFTNLIQEVGPTFTNLIKEVGPTFTNLIQEVGPTFTTLIQEVGPTFTTLIQEVGPHSQISSKRLDHIHNSHPRVEIMTIWTRSIGPFWHFFLTNVHHEVVEQRFFDLCLHEVVLLDCRNSSEWEWWWAFYIFLKECHEN
jgi:hypothetical protein